MLVTTTIILSQEFKFRRLYAKKKKKKNKTKQKKRLTAATYEQNIEAPFSIFEIFRRRIHRL